MHIGFRTSGGRGEYEVVGGHSGYSAASLEGWSFYMHWPDGIVRDTGLWLDPGGSGKPRLRSVLSPQIQIARIIASMLMLPDPTRAFRQTPASSPLLVHKKYTITQVGFSPDSDFAEIAERVTFAPSWIGVANQGSNDAIGVRARWNRILSVYGRIPYLGSALQVAVASHRDYIASGQIVKVQLSSIVASIERELLGSPSVRHSSGADPLPALERLAGLPAPTGPGLPAPDELTEDEPEISARSAHEYRLAKARGSAGRKFSAEVRAAYGNACAFCGAKLGGIPGILSGIDAAHILAWSQHNLDVVGNGIALCKLHHWAFDAGILMPHREGGDYYVRFTSLSALIDPSSMMRLGADGERIPEEWLPSDPAKWPSEHYLELLYADLGVRFRDET